MFASAPESSLVQMLLQTPGIKLMDFAMSEAYSRRFSFLSPAVLPRGVVDLAANIPPHNVRLVAPTTTLLARTETHPALVQLFALAGNTIHGGAGWFKHAREFPNVKNNELPLAQEAERSIRAEPHCCNATYRSGWRIWWNVCGWPWVSSWLFCCRCHG